MNDYYAHSLLNRDPNEWEPLFSHLAIVADGHLSFSGSAHFADKFGVRDLGRLLGLWHDIGKYAVAFQQYLLRENGFDAHLETETGRVDHSTAGARHAIQVFDHQNPSLARVLAYCIAGHHAGLADCDGDQDSCLLRRLHRVKPESADALARAPRDLLDQPPPTMPTLKWEVTKNACAFQASLFTRMLFSCLVDADFLATEHFLSPDKVTDRTAPKATLANCDAALTTYLAQLQQKAASVGKRSAVNERRSEILAACLEAATVPAGLFSLTVPTGGGKTLSSLAFALKHARRHGLDRVIYAVPFTSIIEQNADVFRAALGDLAEASVVEHHSNFDPKKENPWNRLAAENWDAPLVVTTNVQFFESLFANRTSRCRKLHNIARSVIILDEAQTIPIDFLQPCLAVLKELVRNYGCSVVLCTATQPAIEHRDDFPIGLKGVREIVPHREQLYQQMKRVRAEHVGTLSDDELITRLLQSPQVLCIVNTTKHAGELHRRVSAHGEAFHLSARMCPAHRTSVLGEVRRRLQAGAACRVVSTQLIEAGVDVDFPIVYRAMAGLDSIAQAAGRCNREGKLACGQVYVFNAEMLPPRGHLRDTAATTGELIGLYDDLLDPAAIEHYFRLHYWKRNEYWDNKRVMECFRLDNRGALAANFRTAAQRFQFIPDETRPVIIPWDQRSRRLIKQLRKQPLPSREIRRGLQRYTVQIRELVWRRLEALGCFEVVHDQFPILLDSTRYHDDTGLSLDDTFLLDVEDAVV